MLIAQCHFETGFDSLWIYDGQDVNAPLIATLSGDQSPTGITTSGNVFTIRFNSDGATTRAGYSLVWSCPTAAVENKLLPDVVVGPNPARDKLYVKFIGAWQENCSIKLIDITGKLVLKENFAYQEIILDLSNLSPGLYLLQVSSDKYHSTQKILIE